MGCPEVQDERTRIANEMLQAGLGYLARGWSVMATLQQSKKRMRMWKKWQRRRATPRELRADFAAEVGEPNVAIVCGEVSGLAVLDPDGREAEAFIERLNLPTTLTVQSVRGRHRYFHHTGPLDSRSLRLPGGDGIELRADGEYILAPPSVHPSGLVYRFEDPEAPVAELPEAVLDLFPRTPTPSMQASEGPPQRWLDLVARYPSARAVWEGRTTDHPDPTGSGHDMRLAHFARRHRFTRDEVATILRNAPYPVNGGRTPQYVRRTVDRAFASVGTRHRPQAGYGQFPAWVVTSGTWARLSGRAKAVLPVLVVFAERPSHIVRVSMQRLSAGAKVSDDRVGLATDELAEAGIIRKERAPGGRWNIWLQMTPPLTSSAVGAEQVRAGEPERAGGGGGEEHPVPVQPSDGKSITCGAKATPRPPTPQ